MSAKREIPIWKMLIFSLIPLLAIELTARLVAFVIYDFSPYFLVYGLTDAYIDHEEGHTATFDGYYKFPPSRTLKQYGLFTQPTPIEINNHGFRGPDFEAEKADGAFRIVCMGGSSTFGFFGRDDYTYPAILERVLRKRVATVDVEVINVGVPHMNTSNIRAMLVHEVVRYEPDVVTLYSAYNDAGERRDESAVEAIGTWLHGHLATYVALKRLVDALGGPALHSRWTGYFPRSDSNHIDTQVALHVPDYERNIVDFVDVVRGIGAVPILIRQPMTARSSGTPVMPALPYADEIAAIEAGLASNGWVEPDQATMLVHRALLESLDRIAIEQRVEIVDNVAIVDRNPDFFASYVHLSESGNAALAAALANRIEPLVTRRAAGAPPLDRPRP